MLNADQVRTQLWNDRGRAQPSTGTLAPCPRVCPYRRASGSEDRNPSFNVSGGTNGRVLVRCHAGHCSQDEAVAALRELGLWETGASATPPPPPPPKSEPLPFAKSGQETEYLYRDAAGEPVAVHGRWDHADGSKTIRWRLPDGGWGDGLAGGRMDELPLYGADHIAADPEGAVYFVEGEKAADAVRQAGLLAVSLPGGAAQRKFGGLDALAGRAVNLWADNDEPGRALMKAVEAALTGIVAELSWIRVDVPQKGDAFDYFEGGGEAAALTASPLTPTTERLADDLIRVTLPDGDGEIEAVFRGLQSSRRALDSEVSIRPEGAAWSLRRRLNLLSSSGVAALARELKGTWPDRDWSALLSQMVALASDAWTQEDTTIDLAYADEPPAARWMLEGVIGQGTQAILFGDGSSLKTTLAASIAIHVAYDLPWLGRRVEAPGPVLFVDWENDQESWVRLNDRLLAGLGLELEPHRLLYRHARGAPLADIQEVIRRTIQEHGVALLIVDSAGLACGGEPENSLAALGYANAVASLGVASLTLAHVNRGITGNRQTRAQAASRPHGSNFWFQMARVITYQESEATSATRYVTSLVNRKSNLSSSVGSLGVAVNFEDPGGPITLARTDFQATAAHTETPLRDRIVAALDVPLTVQQVIPLLGQDVDPTDEKAPSRIRTALNRLEKDGLVRRQEALDGQTRWEREPTERKE